MLSYVEITCLPSEGINTGFLMGKVFGILHLCLVNMEKKIGINPVGVSFPEYKFGENIPPRIGTKIRLFSPKVEHLEDLALQKQLRHLLDYIHIHSIVNIKQTENMQFAIFKRKQPKPPMERLIRRQLKRHPNSADEIKEKYQLISAEKIKLPYINMISHSNNQRFCLYVQKQNVNLQKNTTWQFSTYGLSPVTPVPDF